MKTVVTQEILRSIREQGLSDIIICPEGEWRNIYEKIAAKYSDEHRNAYALWERLGMCRRYRDPNGWATISKIVAGRRCILFLEFEQLAIKMPNGNLLEPLLRDTFGFVFYITDASMSFLLSFNDHDVVMACGDAMVWLADYYPVV